MQYDDLSTFNGADGETYKLQKGRKTTLDPANKTTDFALSTDKLTGSNPGQQVDYPHGRSTNSQTTGKFHIEVFINEMVDPPDYYAIMFGFAPPAADMGDSTASPPPRINEFAGAFAYASHGSCFRDKAGQPDYFENELGRPFSQGEYAWVEIDLDAGEARFGNEANPPSSVTQPSLTFPPNSELYFTLETAGSGGASAAVNFGHSARHFTPSVGFEGAW